MIRSDRGDQRCVGLAADPLLGDRLAIIVIRRAGLGLAEERRADADHVRALLDADLVLIRRRPVLMKEMDS